MTGVTQFAVVGLMRSQNGRFLHRRVAAPVKGCLMPALKAAVLRTGRCSGRAGVGQASREETAGCTDAVREHTKKSAPGVVWDWKFPRCDGELN